MPPSTTTSDTKSSGKTFSIAHFEKLFISSKARQYMSDMDVQQIYTAIEEKDVALLEKLYDILLEEEASDEQMIRDFVMTKNKLIDGFMVDVITTEKKIVEAPRKEAIAKAEKKEQNSVDDILKNL